MKTTQTTMVGRIQRIDKLNKTVACMSIQDELANVERKARKAQANVEARDQAFISAGEAVRGSLTWEQYVSVGGAMAATDNDRYACVDCLSIAGMGRNVRLDVGQRNFIDS